MAQMTQFQYGYFYDVPRCILLRYQGRRFLLQSAFDEDLDEYPEDYSVYEVHESADDSLSPCSPEFLSKAPVTCIGTIPISQVTFDPSTRKELDASVLDGLIAHMTERINNLARH